MTNIDYYNDYLDYIKQHNVHPKDIQNKLYIHHIIPLSMHGTDTDDNKVELTYLEHVQAHELLFKAYFQLAKTAAHIIVSMVGKENISDIDILNIDNLIEKQIRTTEALHLISKKTVYNRKTLKPVRIAFNDPIPDDCIEKTLEKGSNTFIIDYDIFKSSGKIVRFKWNITQELPASNWKFIKDLTNEEKLIVYKSDNPETQKGKTRWVHNAITKKNIRILKTASLPDGFVEGIFFTEEQQLKQKNGGLKSAQAQQFENGGRWIYNVISHKNKLIDRLAPLPEGYNEGRYNSLVDLKMRDLEKQIHELQVKLAITDNL